MLLIWSFHNFKVIQDKNVTRSTWILRRRFYSVWKQISFCTIITPCSCAHVVFHICMQSIQCWLATFPNKSFNPHWKHTQKNQLLLGYDTILPFTKHASFNTNKHTHACEHQNKLRSHRCNLFTPKTKIPSGSHPLNTTLASKNVLFVYLYLSLKLTEQINTLANWSKSNWAILT